MGDARPAQPTTPPPPWPPQWLPAIQPALQVGAACSAAGLIYGGASGIVRSIPIGVAATAGAIQWFSLATTFSFSRSGIIKAWSTDDREPTPKDSTKASAIAGALSGTLYGVFGRTRLSAVPGAIILSLAGAGGQGLYNNWTTSKGSRSDGNFWKRMGDKSWVPFKVLTNEEYSEMLQEKMLKLDVEIAVTEDKIAALKRQTVEESKSTKSQNP